MWQSFVLYKWQLYCVRMHAINETKLQLLHFCFFLFFFLFYHPAIASHHHNVSLSLSHLRGCTTTASCSLPISREQPVADLATVVRPRTSKPSTQPETQHPHFSSLFLCLSCSPQAAAVLGCLTCLSSRPSN